MSSCHVVDSFLQGFFEAQAAKQWCWLGLIGSLIAMAKKPAGRPKNEVTEVLDVSNLHGEWDGEEEIRDRLRDGGELLVEGKGEDIPSVLSNVAVLQPILTRMSMTVSRPLPTVESLRDEVEAIYKKTKRGDNPENTTDVIKLSWKIRKYLTFIKMKVRRQEVSSVPRCYLI